MGIPLTTDNYFSKQADYDYMSVSQFKDFAGTLAHSACEAAAHTRLMTDQPKAWTTSLLVGSYVDAFFEGQLDAFKAEHRDLICTKASIKKFEEGKGPLELLSDYKKAEAIIARLQRDPLFMQYCSGETQRIMTANLFGVDWKIKMDFFFPDDKITDLKIIRDMQPIWSPTFRCKTDFIHYWGYDIQGAIYQKVVEIVTGRRLPFYICCATKEDITDLAVIEITQKHLDRALYFVERNLPRVIAVKTGMALPQACGVCPACRSAKTLQRPISIDEIMPAGSEMYDEPDEDGDDGFDGPPPIVTPQMRTAASLW